MSAEQRDNNLGIDPELRNSDPLASERALQRKLEDLRRGLSDDALAPGGVLVVVEGPDRGQTARLGEKTVSIGRGQDDLFQLRDRSVTRCQLVVEWDAAGHHHWLRQSGDSSTVINGIPATRNAGVRHELAEGDQIQIGGTVLVYQRCRA